MNNNLTTLSQENQIDMLMFAIDSGEVQQCDGFMITEPKLPILNHYFTYAGIVDGVPQFFVTMASVGKVALMDQFEVFDLAKKHNFTICKHIKFNDQIYNRQEAFERGMSILGKPYKWVGANCENLINYIQTGKTKSIQTRTISAGIGMTGLAMTTSKNKGVRAAGGIIASIGIIALLIDLFSDFDK